MIIIFEIICQGYLTEFVFKMLYCMLIRLIIRNQRIVMKYGGTAFYVFWLAENYVVVMKQCYRYVCCVMYAFC